MTKVLTFSAVFPKYHPKAGQPTYFVEKITKSIDLLTDGAFTLRAPLIPYWNMEEFGACSPKYHTIRSGNRFKAGDYFSPHIWSGKPYNSKQIVIAPDIKAEKVWKFEVKANLIFIDGESFSIGSDKIREIAKNDGLKLTELLDWFQYPKPFSGQIICWNPNIKY